MLTPANSIQLNLNIPAADFCIVENLAKEKGWRVQYTHPAKTKKKATNPIQPQPDDYTNKMLKKFAGAWVGDETSEDIMHR